MKNNSRVQIVLLICIMILCAYSYHPRFFDLASGSIKNHSVVLLAELMIFFLAIISVKKIYFNSTIKVYVNCVLLIALFITFFVAIGFDASYGAVLSMLLPLCGIIIGKNLKIDESAMMGCLRIYMVASILIGFLCIMTNLGAFVIVDQYAVAGKNASGAMLGVSGCIAFYSAVRCKKTPLFLFDIASLLMIFVEMLTMRARLATLGLLLLIFLMIIKGDVRVKPIYVLTGIIFICVALSISFDSIGQFIYDSFFQNKDSNLTSGRTDLNKAALNVVASSPFWGTLRGDYIVDDTYQVHNFLLNTISHYGLLFCIPWVLIYIKIGFSALNAVFRNKASRGMFYLANILILYLYWESLGEYTYPWGPGTITFVPFLLLGNTYKDVESN